MTVANISFKRVIFVLILFSAFTCINQSKAQRQTKPNIILIMTDDQGIGDFGFMGNPYIKTANLDKMASESLNLTNFYVSPVCAPTRASLMTGRFYERTGVYDTYNGGAIMSAEEITMAEALKERGYHTGIFGKWHLGDNYPYRPIDQGFDVAAVHRGGGIGQPGDIHNFFDGDSSYFDPVLFKNGQPEQYYGYCSDVFTDEAIGFIRQHQQQNTTQPFFAYLSFNAPHTPLQLPKEYYDLYDDLEFNAEDFGVYDDAVEKMTPRDVEAAKRVYGMVTNIDDNVGKLMQALKDEGIQENTIVVFLTDNGPQQVRYKLGLRERKSYVFGGGVRVPCLIHYPDKFESKQELDATVAHIDLLPSILDLCGLEQVEHPIDGMSIFSAQGNYSAFENRTLFFEWGRGFPVRYRNFAVVKNHHKLVGNTTKDAEISDFQLFNLEKDPQEKNDIVSEKTKMAIQLKDEMDNWYEEIMMEENYRRVFPAIIGIPHENPVLLNRNDAKGTPVAWSDENRLNYWEVQAVDDGFYDITLHFLEEVKDTGQVYLKMYPYHLVSEQTGSIKEWRFNNVKIDKGIYKLEPYFQTRNRNYIFPFYVSVKRIEP